MKARDANSRLRILVLGYIVRRPLGGGTWPTLQYALGLARLGHDVYFLEDSDDYPACYDPVRHVTDQDPTHGLAYAARVFERVGLGERWAYHDAHRGVWHGPCGETALEICRTADLLINNSGIHPVRPWLAAVPRRAFIDTDPGFEQVRQRDDPARRALAAWHNVFFTLGENIPAQTAAHIPEVGRHWQATRQPVVLDQWPVSAPSPRAPLTTVMLWDSYATGQVGGVTLGMKSASFEPYFDLPSRCAAPMELAVGGPGVPKQRLRAGGWRVINPLLPSADPWTYQDYLRGSLAEFTVAKHGYVVTRCGWFSERSAHYLASGRAVITQDTGFGSVLPTGRGLFSFGSADGAAAAVEAVLSDPRGHGTAARDLAAAHFDSDVVLASLVERALHSAPVERTP